MDDKKKASGKPDPKLLGTKIIDDVFTDIVSMVKPRFEVDYEAYLGRLWQANPDLHALLKDAPDLKSLRDAIYVYLNNAEREIFAKDNDFHLLEKATVRECIRAFRSIIGEVNEFTAKKKELEEKLKIIDQLKKGKTGPVKALDDLATEIPNRVWLTKLEETGGSLSIEGVAIEHEDVSAFMKSLQKSKYYSGIVLGFSRSQRDTKTGTQLYSFKITCSVNYSA